MKQNWTYKKLGEICETTSGGTPSKDHNEYYEGGTIPWLRSGEVANRNITRTEMFITQKGVDNSSAKLIPQNSVVIAMYGATVGQVGILRIEATTNQAVCSITPNDSFVPEFLYYTLLSHKKAYLELAVGGAQPNISQQIIKNTTIPLPPLSTQSRIVSELDLLQSIIDKQKAQLKELDTLAQAVFYDMFGDPVENEKGWEVKKLGDLCDIIRGGSPRPIEQYLGGTIPWIKIGDATKGDDIYLHQTKEHIIEAGLKKTRFIHVGSLIFANCGVSLGFARIITFNGCIHDGWLAFDNISNEIGKVFLLKSLNYCTKYFRSIAPDGTQPNLNTSIMKSFKQIIPPLALQKKYIDKIESIEKQKAAIAQSIAETQKLFDYTMDKYFG